MTELVPVRCPYCGERFEAMVDQSEDGQDYVEDCPVCCRPIEFSVAGDWRGGRVDTRRDSD